MLFCGSEVDNTHVGALFLAAHMLPDVLWVVSTENQTGWGLRSKA